ncbi:hypothetical protein BG846_04538 [Streptomyces fradiae ATCC 10745 = DSM 40063]|uniref:Uncharacterized protein n=1 Tax=Streptomyces fradiae ATCC 10745 = DSM 40063 TaxID=1319510 RepID=A0A1Y2NQU0_STRFR|nr:hypothetical protein BG846_04538 [Streptomyces fradiae ATCC 10745 = DSM 40063]
MVRASAVSEYASAAEPFFCCGSVQGTYTVASLGVEMALMSAAATSTDLPASGPAK